MTATARNERADYDWSVDEAQPVSVSLNVLMKLVIGRVHGCMKQTVSVGGLSSSGALHAVVIVIERQLSLTAMSNDCMEFMHLQPYAQMPDDDTTIDYRYDLLDRIYVYNADYVSKTSVCINYCTCNRV